MLERLPKELLEALRKEMKPLENIRFTAQPIPRRIALRTLPIFLFAIPWTVFSVFWESIALSMWFAPRPENTGGDAVMTGMAIVFPIFGLPFVLIGFGMLASPWIAYRASQKTVYAVTTHRAVILTKWRNTKIQNFQPEQMKDRSKKTRADGSGDITFSRRIWIDSDGDRQSKAEGFDALPDVNAAERAIDELLAFTKNNAA